MTAILDIDGARQICDAADYLRDCARRAEPERRPEPEPVPLPAPAKPKLAAATLRRAVARFFHVAEAELIAHRPFLALRLAQWAYLVLLRNQGLSLADLSRVTGKDRGSVRKVLFYAQRQWRKDAVFRRWCEEIEGRQA